MRKRILILGSNFAGYAAAALLSSQLGSKHDIVVVSATDEFCFTPALLWVPFGLRDQRAIFRPLRPMLDRIGVRLKVATATHIDPTASVVHTHSGVEPFDYLVLATGEVPAPGENSLAPSARLVRYIGSWDEANDTRAEVDAYLDRGGPAAVSVLPNSSQYLLAYEFAFALAHQLLRRGKHRQSSVTVVTPEPFAGQCGSKDASHSKSAIEKLIRDWNIEVRPGRLVARSNGTSLVLDDGSALPYSLAVAFPPTVGVDAVKACTSLVDDKGFVRINASMQCPASENIFAAGSAVAAPVPSDQAAHCGVSKSGYFAQQSGRIAAFNVAAHIRNDALLCMPTHAINAQSVLIAAQISEQAQADHSGGLNRFEWQIPGAEQHWARLALEQHYPASARPRSSAA